MDESDELSHDEKNANPDAHFNAEDQKKIPGQGDWLKDLWRFEQSGPNMKMTTVYDAISNPPFKKADELTTYQLQTELARLFNILTENNIDLCFLCDYDALTQYRFITEELFHEEIEEVRPDGMIACFIYEEFHPNHEYDLNCAANEFLDDLFDRPWNSYNDFRLAREMLDQNGRAFDSRDFVKNIVLFQDKWKRFRIVEKKAIKVEFDVQQGRALLDMNLEYRAGTGRASVLFSGVARFLFSFENGFWQIKRTDIPGFCPDV